VCTDVSTAVYASKIGYYAWRVLKDVLKRGVLE
jgi:hypothetical protein